jgi:hypothetical protein
MKESNGITRGQYQAVALNVESHGFFEVPGQQIQLGSIPTYQQQFTRLIGRYRKTSIACR